jgi:hypothetical protein
MPESGFFEYGYVAGGHPEELATRDRDGRNYSLLRPEILPR